MQLLMSHPFDANRREEAERLMQLARGLLTSPDEEMVVNYLDHAIDTLHMVTEARFRNRPDALRSVPAPRTQD